MTTTKLKCCIDSGKMYIGPKTCAKDHIYPFFSEFFLKLGYHNKMSFFSNNNNNNSGCFHNRYVVPVPSSALASSQPADAGNSQQSARDAVAKAACHEQDRRMAAHIN